MKRYSKISLEKASFSDIEFLWYLRSQPDTYKYFRINRAVSWEEHIDWVLPILLGADKKDLYIIKTLKKPIGQIRFEHQELNKVKVSISILKEFHGKSIATKSLDLAIKRASQQKKMKYLVAEVHKKNLPSIKLFEKLGFKLKAKKENWFKYALKL